MKIKRGQTVLEYAILVAVVVTAAILLNYYFHQAVKEKINAFDDVLRLRPQ